MKNKKSNRPSVGKIVAKEIGKSLSTFYAIQKGLLTLNEGLPWDTAQ